MERHVPHMGHMRRHVEQHVGHGEATAWCPGPAGPRWGTRGQRPGAAVAREPHANHARFAARFGVLKRIGCRSPQQNNIHAIPSLYPHHFSGRAEAVPLFQREATR